MNVVFRLLLKSCQCAQVRRHLLCPVEKKKVYFNHKIKSGLQNNNWNTVLVCAFHRTLALSTPKKTDKGVNEAKAKLIHKLNFKSPEDALPFSNLKTSTLLKIYKCTNKDVASGFTKNRLYFIANKLKCQPSVLSRHMAERTFLYSLSFEWLEKSLNVLLEMGVPGERILRDLWALKYHHETIRNRLQRIKDLGINNLYPWMVRCSEDVLNRSIQITQDAKNILGESNTKMYLADRLNKTPEEIEQMYLKLPALKVMRVTKLKSFLDFLINEGYEVEEIADKIRVLTASQKTVRERLQKLRDIKVDHINLNVLYKDKKGFQKYCDTLESVNK